MNSHSIGDLAQSLTLRRQSASLKSELIRLTQELSSGQVADVTRHLNGNFDQIGDIENRIALSDARGVAVNEALIHATAMQVALEHVQTQMVDASGVATLASDAAGGSAISAAAFSARGALDAIVSALNTEVAGRPVFAGTSLDASPIASADTLMDAVISAVSGATDALGVIAALDAFFGDSGGGFETVIYQGGSQDMSPFRLGEGEAVRLSIRADNSVLRGALKDTVMASLVGEDTLALNGGERLALLRQASGSMRTQIDGLTNLRSDLGYAEGRIGQSASRNAAERTSLLMARGDLLSVDLFDTASKLEQVQLQLETIYTLTARTSRLNLVNFL
jgi:flagellar hook-associated protein 3 FlgL